MKINRKSDREKSSQLEMDNNPGLMNTLTPPPLLVMVTSSDGPLGVTQQPPHYTVPMSMEKPPQITYLSPAYPLLYPPQDHMNSSCPPQLLSLPTQYGHHPLDRGGVGVLGYSALHPFGAFRLADGVERLQPGFLNPKRMKGEVDPLQIRYLSLEAGMDISHVPGGSGIASMSHRRSPKPKSSSNKKDKKSSVTLPLLCPLCHRHLLKEELTQHLQEEMDLLAHLSDSETDTPMAPTRHIQSPRQRRSSPSEPSPLITSEEGQKMDRHQVFQQIKINREERLGARAGRCKRGRVSMEETIKRVPSDAEGPEESRWEDEIRSPDKPLCREVDCQTSPGSSVHSPSDDSDNEDGHASAPSRELSLETLRHKIHELTEKLRNAHTCHICLDSYSVPVTSIQCWHIHCEGCWLRALGSKKLCPQCNTITSPSDLRRVYL
uniref:RING-type domain-containing protein n=2 Tax=Leptobrachium leishanense TaxID=445787 RepID=A0A8C5MFI0_9ANUR